MFKRVVLTVLCFLLLISTIPIFATQERVILVLDASGSMWGQIDGQNKITIAREVIESVIKDWDQNHQLGLIAYGHRKKGDCKDIEELIPVGKLDRNNFNKAVKELNPKGRTPLTDAVRIAAEKLKYTEEKATVILISDGKETCDADPCAIANELEKAGLDFTTHVVGFDVSDKSGIGQLECLAINTGGAYITAKDAAELKTALKTAVKKVVEATPPPKPNVDPETPVNVRIHAIAAENGEALPNTWFGVYHEEKDQFDKTKRVKITNSGYVAEAKFKIKPGKYVFYAQNGASKTEQVVSIEPGKAADIELVFQSGWVRSTAIAATGGKPMDKTWFGIYRNETDQSGKKKRIKYTNSGYVKEASFFLPQGEYILYGQNGASKTEAKITVIAGKGEDEQLIFSSGWLRSTAVAASGGKPIGKTWFGLYREETDNTGRKKRVKHTNSGYEKEAAFFVPVGEYILYAQHGASSTEMLVSVEAGKGKDEQLNFNSGWLRSTAVAAPEGGIMDKTWFGLYREETDDAGKKQRVKHTNSGYEKEASFFVPAGEYILYGQNGASKTEKNVTVDAGKGRDEQLTFNSGWLQATSVLVAGGSTLDKTWFGLYREVVDSSGQTTRVKHTNSGYQPQASFFVPAGEYILYAENGGKKGELKINIEAGKPITAEVIVNQLK